MSRGGFILAATTVVLFASGAGAQVRPLQTEPASTARAGSLLLETGFDAIANEPSFVTGAERTAWGGPLLRLVYSPAAAVELDVEWITRVGVWGDDQRNGAPASDFGDVTLRAKWRFRDGAARGTTLGARFGVVLPQTSFLDEEFRPMGLGPNTIRAFVEGLLTRPLGRVRVHANLGLYLADEAYRPHDQRDFTSYGLAVEWPAAGSFTLLAEVTGRTGDGTPGTDAHGEARAGARLGSGRLRWDAAVRRGLTPADGTWGVTAGLVYGLRSRSY